MFIDHVFITLFWSYVSPQKYLLKVTMITKCYSGIDYLKIRHYINQTNLYSYKYIYTKESGININITHIYCIKSVSVRRYFSSTFHFDYISFWLYFILITFQLEYISVWIISVMYFSLTLKSISLLTFHFIYFRLVHLFHSDNNLFSLIFIKSVC